MVLQKLQVKNFKNIEEMEFVPSAGVNVIYGENGQGKTNLVEAIWCLTGARSFRAGKESEMVMLGKPYGQLEANFHGQDRDQIIKMRFGEKRAQWLNEVKKGSTLALVGSFCAVVFSPSQLELVKSGPGVRRKYLDTAIGQMKRGYVNLLYEYQKCLSQRNSILKDYYRHPELEDILLQWDRQTAKAGVQILNSRMEYCGKLEVTAGEIYSGISSGRERLGMKYENTAPPDEEDYMAALLTARRRDVENGYSTVGIHRDDLKLSLNDLDARAFGSQGQQRSIALSLKLAEGFLLREELGENPVFLLDDVMSELDTARQDYILNQVTDVQVFITCCDPATVGALKNGRSFKLEAGRIVRE